MDEPNNHKPSHPFLIFLQRFEDGFLIGLLALMIGIAVLQIILRNFFGLGIPWGDQLTRILVLWVGLFGAMVAARQKNHISIDLLTRYLPPTFRKWSTCVISLFTSIICAVVAYYGFSFVRYEFEGGNIAFAFLPSWISASIIPIAFSSIALRYFFYAVVHLKHTPDQST
jgi:TRAP-type C4-dicarboxylate transport system permease small subunit